MFSIKNERIISRLECSLVTLIPKLILNISLRTDLSTYDIVWIQELLFSIPNESIFRNVEKRFIRIKERTNL